MVISYARIRRAMLALAGCTAVLSMHASAVADTGDDDDLGIPPICLRKPSLPMCQPEGPEPPPPSGPFPCDFQVPGCPWWQYP